MTLANNFDRGRPIALLQDEDQRSGIALRVSQFYIENIVLADAILDAQYVCAQR